MKAPGLTHEQFVHDVRAAGVAWATAQGTISAVEAQRILSAKLVYGAGDGRYRGVCHYQAWAQGPAGAVVIQSSSPRARSGRSSECRRRQGTDGWLAKTGNVEKS